MEKQLYISEVQEWMDEDRAAEIADRWFKPVFMAVPFIVSGVYYLATPGSTEKILESAKYLFGN